MNKGVAMSKKKTFITSQALIAAVAAYEHNNKRVVRDPFVDNEIEIKANRQLILNYLDGDHSVLAVTEDHAVRASELIDYIQHASLMQTLRKGSADQFMGKIAELLTNLDIVSSDLGLLAWAPKLADDYQKKDQAQLASARFEGSSRYISKVGDKIIMTFTLIESRYIKQMDCYAVYGHNENNDLVFYWAKDEKKVVENSRIQAKVKAHNPDKYHGNARVTTLNYVKVL
jgi:hypothetical protein